MPADVPAPLADALADRYDLRALLGRGGMATVFLARDRKHQRDVAIKVLRPDLAESIGSERFLREIEIVARLSHPHILALYDSGEAGGFVYYVMPYIAGGSLRQQLAGGTGLDTARAIGIAASVADALSYAHEMGVLHRDIKPENILISRGHPIVADFGIAKAVSSASAPHLTRTGLALGTPGYMSPEQAAGFMEIDVRSDVYSLAVVAYEMVTGAIPGRWPTEEEVRNGRLVDAPPLHRMRLSGAGEKVERALVRALAVRPEQRTESPQALVDGLRGAGGEARRKFSSVEVDAIVKRASELEAGTPTGAFTIGGVEAIAADVGIAPAFVRSAASQVVLRTPAQSLAPSAPVQKNPLAGAAMRIYLERVIEGELPEEEFPVVVDEIRRVMQNAGQVGQLGRSFTWAMSRAPARREVEVSVTVRAGYTRIAVSENLGQLAGAAFGGIMGGGGGGGVSILAGIVAGALHQPGLLPVAIPIWFALMYGIARTVFRSNAGKREEEAARLMERLADVVTDLIRTAR